MSDKKNNENLSMNGMFGYLNKVLNYMKNYAEKCRHSFNSMLSL